MGGNKGSTKASLTPWLKRAEWQSDTQIVMTQEAKLKGKVAIVTGSGSGIGIATAIQFARPEARVVCADIDLESASRTVSWISDIEGIAHSIVTDVSNQQSFVIVIETFE
tara:strand:- start:279 stop:608 length:330 start_codon:yes stop_codon:yes gene_type:complete